MTDPQLAAARARAATAHASLATTLGAVQNRLKPAAIADEAKVVLRRKGEAVADHAIEFAAARPGAIAATAAGVGALLALGLAVRVRRRKRIKHRETS